MTNGMEFVCLCICMSFISWEKTITQTSCFNIYEVFVRFFSFIIENICNVVHFTPTSNIRLRTIYNKRHTNATWKQILNYLQLWNLNCAGHYLLVVHSVNKHFLHV